MTTASERVVPAHATPQWLTDEVVALYTEGLSSEEIGPRLGIAPRRVIRILDRAGIERRRTNRPMSVEQREWLAKGLAEGVPATWLAETLGIHQSSTTKYREDPQTVQEWNRAWSQIRHNPTLLELHREFAPRGR